MVMTILRILIPSLIISNIVLAAEGEAVKQEEGGDQKKFNPKLFGNLLIGGVIGGATGLVAGSTTLASSGDQEEAQEAFANLASGIVSGVLAAYRLSTDKIDEKQEKALKEASGQENSLKIENAKASVPVGMIVGAVTGSSLQVASGSSDNGGFVDSSSSLSSSMKKTGQTPNSDANTNADKTANQANQKASLSSASSSQIPAIHNAVAGGVASFSVTYMEPEILLLSKNLASYMADSAEKAKKSVEELKKKKERAVLVGKFKRSWTKLTEVLEPALIAAESAINLNEKSAEMQYLKSPDHRLHNEIENFAATIEESNEKIQSYGEEEKKKIQSTIGVLPEAESLANLLRSLKVEDIPQVREMMDNLRLKMKKIGGKLHQLF